MELTRRRDDPREASRRLVSEQAGLERSAGMLLAAAEEQAQTLFMLLKRVVISGNVTQCPVVQSSCRFADAKPSRAAAWQLMSPFLASGTQDAVPAE